MKARFLTVICTVLFAGFSYAQTLNESFTEETFPPQGWTVYGDEVNDWGRSDKSSNYHTEPAGARVYIAQNTPPFDEWLITPRLDLTATPGIDTLKFWAKTSGTFAAGEKFSIRLSTTNLDTASFTNILYEITTVTDFIEIKIPLNSFESENCVYVAFQAELSWTSYRAALDDVSGPPLYSESIDVGTTALSIFTIPLRIADKDTIAGTFKNFGTSTVKDFYGYFQVSGAESYLDSVLIDSLQAQQEIVKEFYWTPNTEGNVSLSVYTQLDGDGIPDNDITSVTDKVYQTYAIYESFEGSFPPLGWLRLDYGTVGGKSWDQISIDPYDGEYAAVCPKTVTSKSNGEYDEWLVTPHLYCDASTKDTLQFYIRRGSSNPFSITVRLSTTTPDTAEFNTTLLEIPNDIPISIWHEYKAPLEAFDGNSIYIAFHYKNTDVSYSTVQLDMVTAPSLYFSPSDVGVDSIKAPEDSSVVTAPVQPRAVVRNYGNESQTFDVKCEIDIPGQSGGNEYLGSLTVTDLAAYSSQEVLFPEWTPSDFNQQKYIVKFYTSLAGDEFPQNDTLTADVWTDEALPTNDDFASAYYIFTSDFRDTSYTMGMTNDYDSYGTIPWPETGPDVVYAIVIDQAVDTLKASISGMSNELDIFLLNDPDPQSLVTYGSESFAYANAAPDTYYIVIDGFQGSIEPPGSFVLQVHKGTVVSIDLPDENLPLSYDLKQNYPNPFNPATKISYQLADPGKVKLVIYNTLGQKIRTLVNYEQTAGSYSVLWNGKDDNGAKVSSGIYLYHLETKKYNKVRKMILLK